MQPHRVLIRVEDQPNFLFDFLTLSTGVLLSMVVRGATGGVLEYLGSLVLAFLILFLFRWGLKRWRIKREKRIPQ